VVLAAIGQGRSPSTSVPAACWRLMLGLISRDRGPPSPWCCPWCTRRRAHGRVDRWGGGPADSSPSRADRCAARVRSACSGGLRCTCSPRRCFGSFEPGGQSRPCSRRSGLHAAGITLRASCSASTVLAYGHALRRPMRPRRTLGYALLLAVMALVAWFARRNLADSPTPGWLPLAVVASASRSRPARRGQFPLRAGDRARAPRWCWCRFRQHDRRPDGAYDRAHGAAARADLAGRFQRPTLLALLLHAGG